MAAESITAIQSENASTTAHGNEPLIDRALKGTNGRRGSTATRAPNESLNTGAGQSPYGSLGPRPRVLAPEALAFWRLESREGVVLDVDEESGSFRARLVDPRAQAPDQEVEVE